MSNAPLKLVPRKRRAQEGVRKTFLNMIREARQENFVAVAIVGFTQDGAPVTAFEPGEDSARLIGGIEILKREVMNYLGE